jgi:hypothetical protein
VWVWEGIMQTIHPTYNKVAGILAARVRSFWLTESSIPKIKNFSKIVCQSTITHVCVCVDWLFKLLLWRETNCTTGFGPVVVPVQVTSQIIPTHPSSCLELFSCPARANGRDSFKWKVFVTVCFKPSSAPCPGGIEGVPLFQVTRNRPVDCAMRKRDEPLSLGASSNTKPFWLNTNSSTTRYSLLKRNNPRWRVG